MRTTYVTYDEAQTLIPIFRYLIREAPYKDVRRDASVVLVELGFVKQIDYAPLRGRQLILKEREYDLLEKAMNEFL